MPPASIIAFSLQTLAAPKPHNCLAHHPLRMNTTAEPDSENEWFVGIDVGGTSIKLGVITGKGQTISEHSIATRNELGPTDAIERICCELASTFTNDGAKIRGIGLGTPGPLDTRQGLILDPVNLPGWRNFPIRDELSKALDRPVVYTNDANAAAFGEFWIGKGRNCHSQVLITLGTGVGTGIILDDRLIAGANDHAAECGHVAVDFGEDARMCSCGRKGHLEAYASASAVAARAREAASRNPDSALASVLETAGDLTARDVYDCAQKKDSSALETIDQTAEYLARGIADLAHTIDPEIVLLGGAMDFGGENCQLGQRFLMRIDQMVRPAVFQRIADHLRIEFACLGGSAGWIGAAGLAKRVYDQKL